ncbi:prepilin-type N-terminal cleavage/methylation domain-containing protein [Kamptonema cortianum]|nr:prepilin-type N-terminal cleavage/methylation domain-containing protein [Geitlerinema splendidum]MDK3158566.1 prepilin-type N-terminal cleavage/methylation domain-containing protein [Kamptonema cortianum]
MKNRGFSLVEVMVSVSLFGLLGIGLLELFSGSLRFFAKTSSEVEIANENANAMRYVTAKLRPAMSIQIQNNGNKIVYWLPQLNTLPNPLTGEREISIPVTSDGVARSFTITNGRLIDDETGKVVARNISATDPDKLSTQYNKPYAPFQLTTIGSRRAVTVTLISKKKINNIERNTRMKDTVILRNGQ